MADRATTAKFSGKVKSPARRDEAILLGSPNAKSPTPAITDAAPDRAKRKRTSGEMQTPRPASSVRRVGNGGSSYVDIFMEATGIRPDSEGNTYNSTTYNFNKVTNQFQKKNFQYAESKEEAEAKILKLEAEIKNLTAILERPQDEGEKNRATLEGKELWNKYNTNGV